MTFKIERFQKIVCNVILGSAYNAYEELQIKTLSATRKEVALKLAKKESKLPIHKSWFFQNPEEAYIIIRQKKSPHTSKCVTEPADS